MKAFYARCTPWGTVEEGELLELLPQFERNAVIAHEYGHVHHRHMRRRLLWVFSLRAVFQPEKYFRMCEEQELEADQYAAKLGYRSGLISFLWRHSLNVKSPGYPTHKARLEALHHV
jgi:hypothetical protein